MEGVRHLRIENDFFFSDMARYLVKIMKGIDVNTIIYIYIFISEYIYNKLDCEVACTCKHI